MTLEPSIRRTGNATGLDVFLCAHQDDEFSFLYTIQCSLAEGRDLLVLFLTDGGNSEVRNEESRKVLEAAGVHSDSIEFIGGELQFTDGKLMDHLLPAWRAINYCIEGLSSRVKSIYMPAWEGGHQDHDVLHVLGVCLARKLGVYHSSRQIGLYHCYGMSWIFYRVLSPLKLNGPTTKVPIPPAKRLKFLILFLNYRSQFMAWIGLYPFVILDYLLDGTVKLQPISWSRIHQAPHPGVPLYERRGFSNLQSVTTSIDNFLQTISPELSTKNPIDSNGPL
ncbi:PIG-L family deacetylase [Halieaceae bacterium IMCC14734]|uniref:PIG-L family deacetylase n=1 Tax=Candidatus Litorirhabdus singularis TaxID=2518993 RepID=A0ABT3TPP0_9GAMM|nr:PIG-L family deacetylase [Candidatus Litorirhabdus singularis]MCX2983297.1 PIG-L family deacetylase [Candidatus Litorirhabdus singularis]